MKRLSVIIPGYANPRSYWERCLKSVLANLGREDEVFCVDDGSPSRPEFLNDMAMRDSRIKVLFLEKNVGLPSARNAALEIAKGKYVTFVDSDDEVCPDVYADAISLADRDNADIVVFGVRTIWLNEGLCRVNLPFERSCGELRPDEVRRLYDESVLNYAWNKIYCREFLEKINLRFDRDGVPCEDIIFVLKCIMAGSRWAALPREGIVYYRTHGTLLSRYKSTYLQGTRLAAETWREYADSRTGCEWVNQLSGVSDRDLLLGEWDNIWRLSSPYSYLNRYRFACLNFSRTVGSVQLFFLKKFIVTFVRKWLYVAIVRRWHIRRIYPDVVDL